MFVNSIHAQVPCAKIVLSTTTGLPRSRRSSDGRPTRRKFPDGVHYSATDYTPLMMDIVPEGFRASSFTRVTTAPDAEPPYTFVADPRSKKAMSFDEFGLEVPSSQTALSAYSRSDTYPFLGTPATRTGVYVGYAPDAWSLKPLCESRTVHKQCGAVKREYGEARCCDDAEKHVAVSFPAWA